MQCFRRLTGDALRDRADHRSYLARGIAVWLVMMSWCLTPPWMVRAQPVLEHNFDSQTPMLRPQEAAVRFQILHHEIDRENFRFGSGAERIGVHCPAGHSAPFAYQIPRAPVIGEFQASLWVLSNKPGTQLAARVVLPRSVNPSTGRPEEVLVRGLNLGRGMKWENLTISGLPSAVTRMARVTRKQAKHPIDERGAYVSQLVLLAPGGPGVTELLVDRIELHGVLSDPNPESRTRAGAADSTPLIAAPSTPQPPVSRPRVPRVVRWQGEPFELLSRLGFQAVGMSRLPTEVHFKEAKKHGLLLVCPPPPAQRITAEGISDQYDEVLAWDLGDQLSENDLQQMVRWQQLINRYDNHDQRPTVLAPQRFTREASRIADVVLLDRPTLGTDLSLRDYATWLTHRSRLARQGTPMWTRMQTQLDPRQVAQVTGLGANLGFNTNASYLHLVSLTSAAIGVKSTGFYFESHSSLAENDAATFQRAQALELTNLRLGLMEPWLATGKTLTGARSSEPRLTALVLQAERSHLLVPVWWSNQMYHVNPPPPAGPLSFIVPGVAESSEAYLLTMGGPQRLRHQRVTGGIRISLDRLPADGLVLLTNDPGAFSQVARYLRRHAPRATQLRRNLAAIHWQDAARAYPAVASHSISPEQRQASLATAKQALADSDAAAASGNFELAYRQADAMEKTLAASDYLLWQETTAGQSVAENPLASHVATLPALERVNRRLASALAGENLLPQGGFEDLSALLEAGWRHHQLPLAGITSAVRLSPEAPHHGQFCLELEAQPLDPDAPPAVVPTAAVWITSQAVSIQAGNVIEITGQARVPKELLGSVDGLQIMDSLGGPQQAVRIKASPSWQPFRMVRVATVDAEVNVSVALTGMGKAQIDDLALRTVTRNNNDAGGPTHAASLPPRP